MKTSIKLTAGLFLAAAALVASGTSALAGEGGAAGSVAFQVNPYTGAPGSLSSSIAVGKATAATLARTTTTNAYTSAIGGGGLVTITNAGGATAGLTLGIEDPSTIGILQLNTLIPGAATIKGNGSVITTAIP